MTIAYPFRGRIIGKSMLRTSGYENAARVIWQFLHVGWIGNIEYRQWERWINKHLLGIKGE